MGRTHHLYVDTNFAYVKFTSHTQVQIMILSKYSVIDNLQIIFHSQFVGVIINYLHTKLHTVHIMNIKVLHINCIKKTINCTQTMS